MTGERKKKKKSKRKFFKTRLHKYATKTPRGKTKALLSFLSLEILNLADGAAEEHGEDHAEQFNDPDPDSGREDVREVLVQKSLQLGSASLSKR